MACQDRPSLFAQVHHHCQCCYLPIENRFATSGVTQMRIRSFGYTTILDTSRTCL